MKRVYIVKLTPTGGADGIRALRALLKSAGRRWGLRCIGIEVETADRDADQADRASRQRLENRP